MTSKVNLLGLLSLVVLGIGLLLSLAPLATRKRGLILQGLAITAAGAIAVLGALGVASSIDGLPNRRATLVAKIVGGAALLLVPLFRWRSIRKGLSQVLHQGNETQRLPFSFRRAKGRADGKRAGRHFGVAKTVRNAAVIEVALLIAAVVVAIVLMRQ